MRQSASFSAVLMLSALVTGLLGNLSPAEAGGGNCQARLVGNSYNCTAKETTMPSPQTFCAEFETGGTSANFDLLVVSSITTDLGCACDTTGSYSSPSFDTSSSAFECVDDHGTQFNGKIKSKKLDGQASDAGGDSLIYTCTLSATACK
jgi:hypothetical protein